MAIFPADTATVLTGAITTAISDNIGVIMAVLGFMVGVFFVRKMLNRGLKGKA